MQCARFLAASKIHRALLMIGKQIGILSCLQELIGAGGMGEVYRARDTKLGRDVAIKVLPQRSPRDPDRLARFEREARLLAALNHPNIGAFTASRRHDGMRALVMELVEGETLAERLPRPHRRLDEALRSRARLPMRSTRRTKRASSTAISSPRTSRSPPTAW